MKSNLSNFAIVLTLMIIGLYFVALKFVHVDFSKIPGDMGDARFNNYILEHGYQYLTGKIHNYWQGNFMYPYPNVIALSDNLLGTVPIYSIFRSLAIDRETSFQYWFLTLFTLNYLCCYWALKKWSNHVILSAVGAYVYAFGLYNHGEIFHAQVFPRFIAPLVFYWTWKFISGKESKYLLLASVGLIYQFYCGVYLGFLLIYVLLFFLIAYLIVYRDVDLFKQYQRKQTLFTHLGIFILAIVLFLPLMIPYFEISKATGVRSFDAAFNSLPRIQSYFFTSPASVTWNFLYPLTAYSFPEWWNHFLFTGIVPWLGVLIAPVALTSKKITKNHKQFIGFLGLGFFLSFIFCLNINGFTLYKIIYLIPGFSSMRSLDRIINTQVIFLVLLFVFSFKFIGETSSKIKLLIWLFPILVIFDNLIVPEPHKSFFKSDAQNEVNFVKQTIQSNMQAGYDAIAYVPIEMIVVKDDTRNNKAVSQTISTMIACQELNIKCVNGYSGFNPGNFEMFFLHPGTETLEKWCEFNHYNNPKIQVINETGEEVIEVNTVHLKSSGMKYLCADEGLNNNMAVNKDHAYDWETFKMVELSNNKCVFQSHRNLFFSLTDAATGQISATAPRISNREIFTIITTSDSLKVFKADNGKFLSVEKESGLLKAKELNSEFAETFIVEKL